MGIDDAYTAWCFDEACSIWGNTISDALRECSGESEMQVRMAQEMVYEQYLGVRANFADPKRG